MRKSLMLSTTIMLIILFLTLSATTYAWYQAAGGTITVSASSDASVTTTGPDNPYLIISGSSNGSGPDAQNFTTVQITDSNISSYSSKTIYSTSASRDLSVASLTINNSSYYWTSIIGQTPYTPVPLKFYVRNTSESFDLAATISIIATINGVPVDLLNTANCDYRVLLEMQQHTGSNLTTILSNTYNGNVSAANSILGDSATIEVSSKDVIANKFMRCVSGDYYECYLYIWIDSYDSLGTIRANSHNIDEIFAISSVTVTFDNITIVTSGS